MNEETEGEGKFIPGLTIDIPEDENKTDEDETKGEVPTQCTTISQEEHDLLVKEALLGQLYGSILILKQLNILVVLFVRNVVLYFISIRKLL